MMIKKKNKKVVLNKKVSFPDNSKGMFAILVDILLFILAMYSGDYIIWSIAITMGILFVVSFFTALFSYYSLSCMQYLSKSVVAKNEQTELVLECKNSSPLFMIYAIVLYQTPTNFIEQQTGITAFTILRRQSFLLKIKINTEIKGIYDVGFLEMRITDYFGFFAFKPKLHIKNNKYYTSHLSLVVTPCIHPIAGISPSKFHDSMEERTDNMGNNEQSVISDLRTYQYGDPLNRINWKATAKHREVYINNFEKGFSTNVGLYIGHLANKDRINQLITEDFACECAASLINYFVIKDISVELFCDSIKESLYIQGKSQRGYYLMHLAENNVVTTEDSLMELRYKIASANKFDYFYMIIEDITTPLLEFIKDIRDVGTSVSLVVIKTDDCLLDSDIREILAGSGVNVHIIPQGSQINSVIGGQA